MRKYIYLILFILISPGIYGACGLYYDDFMRVNTTETISVHNGGDDCSDRVFVIIEDVEYELEYINSTTQFEIQVTNDIEEDINFTAFTTNKTGEFGDNTDGSFESFETITDQTIYTMSRLHEKSHLVGDLATIEICINQTGALNNKVIFVVGNTLNDTIYWEQSVEYDISGDGQKCGVLSFEFDRDYPENYTQYGGFYCSDCNLGSNFDLYLDTTNITTTSHTFDDINDNTPTNITTGNVAITGVGFSYAPADYFSGVMKWRIPFNVTINLYSYGSLNSTQPQPYLNDFNYVILSPEGTDTKYGAEFINTIESINSMFYGDAFSKSMNTNLAFWGKYENGEAIITLYEANNYTLKLGVSDTIYSSDWKYEFIYPQYSNLKYLSDITEVAIDEEIEQELLIYADKIEIDTFNVVMNFTWAIVIFIVWVVAVGLITYFTNGQIGLVVAGSTIPIIIGVIMGII